MDHKPPPLYVKSKWQPPYESIPTEIQNRFSRFFTKLNKLFIRRNGASNLLTFQATLIQWLKHHNKWMIANTDKNIGPCAIEIVQYLKDAHIHLDNGEIYKIILEAEALMTIKQIEGEING